MLEATNGYASRSCSRRPLRRSVSASSTRRWISSGTRFRFCCELQGSVSEARRLFGKGQPCVGARAGWTGATRLARALTTADEFGCWRRELLRVRRARKMRLLDASARTARSATGVCRAKLCGGLTGSAWSRPGPHDGARAEDRRRERGAVTYERFVDAFGPDDDDFCAKGAEDEEERDDGVQKRQKRGGCVSRRRERRRRVRRDGSAPRRDDSDLFGLNKTVASAPYDPLGALGGGDVEPNSAADGWGGEEDLIDFDGAAGAGRAKIEARSLSDPGKKDLSASVGAGARVGPNGSSVGGGGGSGAPGGSLLSQAAATRGVPLSREVLAGIRAAVKPHSSFTRVWTSEATGSRRAASFWHAKPEQSFAARNRDRVPLGSYATPGLATRAGAPVTANGGYGQSGKHANALEVTDTKAWAMAGRRTCRA